MGYQWISQSYHKVHCAENCRHDISASVCPLSDFQQTSGRLRKMYTRSRRRTSSGEVRRDSLNKFRPILGGIGIV